MKDIPSSSKLSDCPQCLRITRGLYMLQFVYGVFCKDSANFSNILAAAAIVGPPRQKMTFKSLSHPSFRLKIVLSGYRLGNPLVT